MFREHVAVGAVVSMVVVVALYFYALVTDPILLVFLFGVTVVGSFLPDVDSDSSMPFYLVFGTMTLAATGVVLLYTLNSSYAADWRYLTGIPAAALFVFWFIIGGIVKRCTHHRGIFHSLPATAIAALGALLVARYYGLPEELTWLFGGAMAIGYLCHLLLDELHAGITLDGIPFNPKSTFGSAMKLFSNSNRVNIATYLVLATLAYVAFTEPTRVHAYFYNDSNVIEIGDGEPTIPESSSSDGEGSYAQSYYGGAGGGTTYSTYAQSSYGSEGGDSESDDEGSGGAETADGGTENSGGDGGGSSGFYEDADDDGDFDEDDIIELLIEAGVITVTGNIDGGEESSGASSANGSGILPGANGVTVGGGIIEIGEGGSITINGREIREILGDDFDLQEVLQRWKMKGRLSARGMSAVAATVALTDTNVENIVLTAGRFEITYRSRGYLLAVIPMSFPVRVTIEPQASELADRVTVKLPWYRFFVREFFTARKLAQEIDEAMRDAVKNMTSGDQNAVLFEAVATFLRRKVGTISDTVFLGTPQQ